MKSICLTIFAAALAMTVSACGNKVQTTEAPQTAQAADTIKDGTTYEGKNYSLVYPKELKETYADEEIINAEDQSDNYCHLDATYNDYGPTLDQLKLYATNWVGMKEAEGCSVDKPAIDGKNITIKAVKDGETEIHFVVMKEDRIGISGSLKFKSEKLADYEPVVKSIMNSIKFK